MTDINAQSVYFTRAVMDRVDRTYPPPPGLSPLQMWQLPQLLMLCDSIEVEEAARLSEQPPLGADARAFITPDRRGIFYVVPPDRRMDKFQWISHRFYQMSERQARNARRDLEQSPIGDLQSVLLDLFKASYEANKVHAQRGVR